MGKHLEQALAFCVYPPVPNWLIKADKDNIDRENKVVCS